MTTKCSCSLQRVIVILQLQIVITKHDDDDELMIKINRVFIKSLNFDVSNKKVLNF